MSTSSSKKRAYASNAILYAFFVVGVIVLVNVIGTRFFGRIDLTENKVYTLSQPSRDLVKTPARLPYRQGLHLVGFAPRDQDPVALCARHDRRVPHQLQRKVPLGGH